MAASVLRGHRLGHPGVVGWPSRWIGLALPASIAYTALGGIRLIDPAGWIGPPSLVTGGPPAPGVWWWMILAPIFLGEPRLCTQKMVGASPVGPGVASINPELGVTLLGAPRPLCLPCSWLPSLVASWAPIGGQIDGRSGPNHRHLALWLSASWSTICGRMLITLIHLGGAALGITSASCPGGTLGLLVALAPGGLVALVAAPSTSGCPGMGPSSVCCWLWCVRMAVVLRAPSGLGPNGLHLVVDWFSWRSLRGWRNPSRWWARQSEVKPLPSWNEGWRLLSSVHSELGGVSVVMELDAH